MITRSLFGAFVVGALVRLGVSAELVDAGSVPCDFPNEPQFLDPPFCPPTTLNRANATALAWQFAPEIRFHSLEESFLLDPAVYFQQGSLFAPTFLLGDEGSACQDQGNVTCEVESEAWRNLTQVWDTSRTTAQFLHRSFISAMHSTALTEQQKNALVAGNSFDAQGRSMADMTYTIQTAQDGNAWIMTFHQFYALNGCSNQALSTRAGNQFDVLQYYLCPDGRHEGDWEHVGLYICPADLEAGSSTPRNAIRRVHYSQNERLQEYDCSKQGQCPFEEDAQSESKLVAYSALFSHANYPKASPLWVTSSSQLGFLGELDGLYVGDRTQGSASQGRRWVPTAQNLRYVPPAEEFSQASSDQWALFPGSWGPELESNSEEGKAFCFNSAFSSAGDCDESSASFQLLSAIMAAQTPENGSDDGMQMPKDHREYILGAERRNGPLQRDYTYSWLPEVPAPVHERQSSTADQAAATSMPQCPAAEGSSTSAGTLSKDLNKSKLLPTFYGVLAFTFGAGLVVALALLLAPRLIQSSESHRLLADTLHGDDANSSLEEKPTAASLARAWAVPVLAILLFIAGAVLVGISATDVFSALEDVYAWSSWDTVFALLITLLVVGILTHLLLVGLLMRANPTHPGFSRLCFTSKGGAPSVQGALKGHMGCMSLLAVVLVVQLLLTVGLIALGFLLLIARNLLADGCKNVRERVNGILETGSQAEHIDPVCLDLSSVGLNSVQCGAEVVSFCNAWQDARASFVLWGALCMMLSHLVMLQLLYQRGHTLSMILRLQSSGLGPSRSFSFGKGGRDRVVKKGGMAWTIGKPTAADRLNSVKVANASEDKLDSIDHLEDSPTRQQRSCSPPTGHPQRKHLAHKNDWEPIILTPRGGPHGAASSDAQASLDDDPDNPNAASSRAGGPGSHHIELSPSAQRASASAGTSPRGGWEPEVFADRRTVQRRSDAHDPCTDSDIRIEHTFALEDAPQAGHGHARAGSVHSSVGYGSASAQGGNSAMSGAETGSGSRRPPSSSQSPSFTLKRDAAVQHHDPDAPSALARENPLFELDQNQSGRGFPQGSGGAHSPRYAGGAQPRSARGAGAPGEPRAAGLPSSVPYPDSPPRRKGPQPGGLKHLGKGPRQDPDNPGFEQMYSPSNPPKDIGTWTPRGKGFVTII